VTSSEGKRSFWEVSTPEWCPEGTFALNVSGNADGRNVAKEWALMIRECDKRDGNSAYVVATRTMNKKGGIWTFEAVEGSSTVGALKYVGNRDGRRDAIGWYLAVHDSVKKDGRDKSSSYVIATKEAAKATLWELSAIPAGIAKVVAVDDTAVAELVSMGFADAPKARAALEAAAGDTEVALTLLVSDNAATNTAAAECELVAEPPNTHRVCSAAATEPVVKTDGWDLLASELEEMGFVDSAANKEALEQAGHDVKTAVKILISKERNADRK